MKFRIAVLILSLGVCFDVFSMNLKDASSQKGTVSQADCKETAEMIGVKNKTGMKVIPYYKPTEKDLDELMKDMKAGIGQSLFSLNQDIDRRIVYATKLAALANHITINMQAENENTVVSTHLLHDLCAAPDLAFEVAMNLHIRLVQLETCKKKYEKLEEENAQLQVALKESTQREQKLKAALGVEDELFTASDIAALQALAKK